MAKEYFCAYHSYLESMRNLSDAECGRLFRALLAYSAGTELINLQGRESIAFDFIKAQIDRDNEKYSQKCQKNRDNALNRTQTNADERKQTKANASERSQRKGKEKGEEKSKGEDTVTPLPPFADRPLLQDAFDRWLKYKTERKEQYKPQGLQALITEVRNNADKYGDGAVASLINECMAANWRGIIFDRLANRPAQKSGNVFAQIAHEEGLF